MRYVTAIPLHVEQIKGVGGWGGGGKQISIYKIIIHFCFPWSQEKTRSRRRKEQIDGEGMEGNRKNGREQKHGMEGNISREWKGPETWNGREQKEWKGPEAWNGRGQKYGMEGARSMNDVEKK